MKRKCIRIACLIAFALAASAAVMPALGGSDTVAWSAYTVPAQMKAGETLELPDVTATLNGESRSARAFVYYPDGSTVRESKFVSLDSMGAYTVEFRANFDDRLYTRSHTVTVGQNSVTTAQPKDKVEYAPSTAVGPGLKVTLGQGSSLTINRRIDLRRYALDKSVLELYITPAVPGVREIGGMRVELIDAYDPTVRLTIDYAARTAEAERGYSTVYAGPAGGTLSGVNPADGRAYPQNEGEGSVQATGFYGGDDIEPLVVRYNNVTNRLYGNAATEGKTMNGVRLSPLVLDADEASLLSRFGGFRTGEVTVSLTPYNFSGKTAGFVLTSVAAGDIDLASGGFYTEPITPEIVVDYGDYSAGTVPAAVAGKPYRLFTASAVGAGYVERRVYRDYYTSSRVELPVVNGTFTPPRAGSYVIEFTAYDNYGKPATVLVPVPAYGQADLPAEKKLTLTVDVGELSALVGIPVDLPGYEYAGGIDASGDKPGNVSVSVTAAFGGETTAVTGDTFTPEKAGDHVLTFTASDYAGQTASAAVTVRASPNKNPVFLDEPALPRYFIAGKTYPLPVVSTVLYGEPDRVIEPQIYVTGGDLDESAHTFTPSADAETATIVYSAFASSTGGEAERKFESIPIVNVRPSGTFDLTTYFDTVNLTAAASPVDIRLNVENAGAGSAYATFICSLLDDFASVNFYVPEGGDSFDSADISFTDSVNGAQSVFLRVSCAADGTATAQLNGSGPAVKLGRTFVGDGRKEYVSIGFDPASRSFTSDAAGETPLRLPVSETSEGGAFSGFDSGKVYLTVRLNGVTGPAAIGILSVNNHTMNSAAGDTIRPQISAADIFGMYANGSELTVPAAAAGDVCDPNVTFTLTVRDSANKIVTAADGTLLDTADPTREYVVGLTAYGTYSFTYTATDSNRRKEEYLIAVNVVDDVPPVIRLPYTYAATARTGETAALVPATVTDNVDEEPITAVFMKLPGGKIEVISDEFTFESAGRYELTYYAMDRAGNMAVLSFVVTVE